MHPFAARTHEGSLTENCQAWIGWQVRQVVCHTPAVLAGLALLEGGGDFADGVIAFEGDLLGGTEFVSFDQQAVKLLKAQKHKARLL